MKKILSLVAILIGTGMLLGPSLTQGYLDEEQDHLLKAYEIKLSQIRETSEPVGEVVSSTNREDFEEPLVSLVPMVDLPVKEEEVQVERLEPIGLLTIPAIDFKQVVMPSASQSDLAVSVGHVKGTAWLFEEGNITIAGHRSKKYGRHFNRLDELEQGALVTLESEQGQVVYEIYDQFIVEPSEVWVLDPVEEGDTLTLITCIPINNPTHRLIVRGKKCEG